ncbi:MULTISPECIES: VVA0879 family protein [Bacillati]|uniref:Phage protein n=2 Tax=Bacillati TaxID=1783272 RepID=A0ABN1TD30_9ACTN
MIKQTLDKWRVEARERFGDKGANWKFVCPSCGNVRSPQDFINAGCSEAEASRLSYQGCIGRIAHAGMKVEAKSCNWSAYGLLGTMGKGRIVITPDGQETEVFDFAKEASE